MNLLKSALHRLRSLFNRRRFDAEMDEEMRNHIALQTEANCAAGMGPKDARDAALRQFGHLDTLQEVSREQRGFVWMTDLAKDVSFACRILKKSPGFALTVVGTLAFGMAVNTTIFSMINVMFLQPLPLKDAEKLVVIVQKPRSAPFPQGLSFPDFRDMRQEMTSVENLIAFMPQPASVSLPGRSAERTWLQLVIPDAFQRYGVVATKGRTLLASDGEGADAKPVAVISHSYWQNQLGSAPDVVGSPLLINGHPFTIVGILPPTINGFAWGLDMSVFVSTGTIHLLAKENSGALEGRGHNLWRLLAHIKPGHDLRSVRSELSVVADRLFKAYPDTHKETSFVAYSETHARPDPSISEFVPAFAAFFLGMVALVLVIACANVANLMMARAAAREREFSLRAAVGATRFRLVRQLLVESLVLAALAGIASWYISSFAGSLLQRFTPQSQIPVVQNYEADWRNYVFAVLATLVAGVASGLVPALRASRANVLGSIRRGGSLQGTEAKHRLRNLLVTGQIACSLVVLVCAGLFLRSLHRAQNVPLGFDGTGVINLSVDLKLQGYSEEKARQFFQEALTRLRSVPDVQSATVTTHVPFDVFMNGGSVWPDVPPPTLKNGSTPLGFASVAPGYLEDMQVPLIKGRSIQSTDEANAPKVVVVNETLAAVCWPGENPIGRTFRLWWSEGPRFEVVGVTRTGKYTMLGEAPSAYAYFPLAQQYGAPASFLVRAKTSPSAVLPALREVLRSLDPNLPVFNVKSMEEHLASSVFGFMPMRMGATMTTVQGVIALLLAVLGIYGVVSYSVSRRTQEIGIRMALGSTQTGVTQLVVKEGLRLTIKGLAAGAFVALLIGAALSKIMYGLPIFDPLVFLGITSLLLLTTVVACWWPARRAARVNPIEALRTE